MTGDWYQSVVAEIDAWGRLRFESGWFAGLAVGLCVAVGSLLALNAKLELIVWTSAAVLVFVVCGLHARRQARRMRGGPGDA